MLTAENICKSFGEIKVLQDTSIVVSPGEIAAIIGPSGSGKSTFLRALGMLEVPDTGTISLDDDNYEFPLRANEEFVSPWPKLTLVFQQLFLWPHLTIRENITLPIRLRDNANVDTLLDEVIVNFELRDFIDRYPNQVSIGERQRAALARAIALKPKYLLLDEITSALDVEHVNHVLAVLVDFAKTNGTAIVLVTHHIAFARRAAQQVLFMESGRFVETGGPAILDKPKTERLTKFLLRIHTPGEPFG